MNITELYAVIPLVIATVLGASVGIERSLAGKQAGMRTYALVSLGSCLLTVGSIMFGNTYIGYTNFDPLRVAAAIVMGIGFIGTGVVVLRGDQTVGLTTAAGIWVAAAIGVTVGLKLYVLAVAGAVLTIATFTIFWRLEQGIQSRLQAGGRESITHQSAREL